MKIIVFKDGSTREITGEAGKYWLTGEGRVRKLSGSIAEVREIPEIPSENTGEKAEANKPAPKKKTARKKKTTEAQADGECGE